MKCIRREYGVEIDGMACPNLKAGSGRIHRGKQKRYRVEKRKRVNDADR
jgi:hypothetical protein